MKAAPVILSIIMPGFGHLWSGRVAKGALAWAAFLGFALMAYVRGLTLKRGAAGDAAFAALLAAAGAVWAWAIVDALDFTYGLGAHADPDEVDDWLRAGVAALLRGDAEEAVSALERARRLAPREPAAALHLAEAAWVKGDKRKALRALRRCRRLDEGGEWAYDMEELYHRIRGE